MTNLKTIEIHKSCGILLNVALQKFGSVDVQKSIMQSYVTIDEIERFQRGDIVDENALLRFKERLIEALCSPHIFGVPLSV